ncbi:MAG: ATP/GTP-binding protein [Chitinophagaceae bacterium]|nr:ATP/GTP-binding protein [Chitinophagaceae bacterium]
MKKYLLLFVLIACCWQAEAQPHSLVKSWETDSVFRTPESVLYDAKANILYVSNMDPDHPGLGSIGKLSPDGKTATADWVKGLTSPKGMGIYRNMLYVAELTDVAVIDIEKATIVKRIPVEGAAFLNDISIDKKGTVYVSDSRTLKIHRIEKGIVGTLVANLQGPNGLLAVGDDLLVLDKGSLIRITAGGQVGSVATGMDPTTDGVEEVRNNEYIVSGWNGVLYYIGADGNRQTLLDTRPAKINSADIGYDPKRRMVYVPTFFSNKVVAYELK